MSEGTQLIRYDAMCRAIAEALEVDEVKDIRDKARAIEMYARQAQNTEAEQKAREIRLRAERKCGGMLTEREMAKAGRPPANSSTDPRDYRGADKLSDLGISYDQSSQWQKLAAVPEETFEAALAEPNPSTSGIITRHEVAERGPTPAMGNYKALWVWGALKDFEREGILDAAPAEMFDGIYDHMRATMLELAPRVAEWLNRLQAEGGR